MHIRSRITQTSLNLPKLRIESEEDKSQVQGDEMVGGGSGYFFLFPTTRFPNDTPSEVGLQQVFPFFFVSENPT